LSRGVRDSLARGALSVAANPGLVLAPLVVATGTLVALVLSVLALFLAVGLSVLRELVGAFRKGGDAILRTLDTFFSDLLLHPGPLVVAVLAATLFFTLVFLLAAALRAGTLAVLVEVDRKTPEGAARSSFHLDWGAVFREGVRRSTSAMFWLLNAYALAVSLLVLIVVLGVVATIAAAATGGNPLPGLAVLFVSIPIFLAGALAIQLVLLASEWAIVAHGLGMMDGIAKGISRLKESLGRSVGLFFVVLLVSMAVGGVLAVPRTVATLLFPHFGLAPLLVVVGLFFVVEMVASYYLQLFVSGCFVALWSEVPEVGVVPAAPPPLVPEPPTVQAAAADDAAPYLEGTS
jgi:hypothetical protein